VGPDANIWKVTVAPRDPIELCVEDSNVTAACTVLVLKVRFVTV
jgi:hypothetical protein